MNHFASYSRTARFVVAGVVASCSLSAIAAEAAAVFTPGNLVVSRSVYTGNASSVALGELLPPNCVPSLCSTIANGSVANGAIDNGAYPYVFNNVLYDAAFGITSPIVLDELTPTGTLLNTLEVPNSRQQGITNVSDQLVTSFTSKSEEALHLSTDGKYLTFIDYVAPVNTVDVSNANTPAAIDSTNPVPGVYYRAVGMVNAQGQFTFTETNAYSGNNGRAAILVNTGGNNFFYTVGNAGNGSNPEPKGVVLGAGAQIVTPSTLSEYNQNTLALPTPVASFSVTQLGNKADKIGKDDNFRGVTLYNNVLYITKGSGGNGVNTVYFVDTTGKACTKTGVGLPQPSAPLPTASIASSYTTANGLANNMCVLAGFSTVSNKTGTPTAYPFGLWFANPTTLYVADEGNGTTTYNDTSNTYTAASGTGATGGLQKWIFNATTQTWQLAYTLSKGLNLGVPYSVAGYPTGNNSATGLPWAPATDGLRNIIGNVSGNALHGQYVTIWATSSTISGNGDTGADPNKLFVIIDKLSNTTAAQATSETFSDIDDAKYGEVLRGISFTPGTTLTSLSY